MEHVFITLLICVTVLASIALIWGNTLEIKIIRATEVPPPPKTKEDEKAAQHTEAETNKSEQPRTENEYMDGVIRNLNNLMGISTINEEK